MSYTKSLLLVQFIVPLVSAKDGNSRESPDGLPIWIGGLASHPACSLGFAEKEQA